MNASPEDILVIKQAFVLLIIGMGIAFAFMYGLVWIMRGIAKIVPRFNHLLPDLENRK